MQAANGFREALHGLALLLTVEGRIDRQTAQAKLPPAWHWPPLALALGNTMVQIQDQRCIGAKLGRASHLKAGGNAALAQLLISDERQHLGSNVFRLPGVKVKRSITTNLLEYRKIRAEHRKPK